MDDLPVAWRAKVEYAGILLPIGRRGDTRFSSPVATPGCRARPDALRKDARKVALINKSRSERDLTKRIVCAEDELLRQLKALMNQPLVRRQSDGLLERPAEMAGGKPAGASQLHGADVFAKICPQPLLYTFLLPWCEASSDGANRLALNHIQLVVARLKDNRRRLPIAGRLLACLLPIGKHTAPEFVIDGCVYEAHCSLLRLQDPHVHDIAVRLAAQSKRIRFWTLFLYGTEGEWAR